MGEGGRARISKNVIHAGSINVPHTGSQLTFETGEGGGTGISKNVTHN